MKEDELSNYVLIDNRITEKERTLLSVLDDLDNYIDIYKTYLDIDFSQFVDAKLAQDTKLGTLQNIENQICKIINVLHKETNEILKLYSYQEIMNRAEIGVIEGQDQSDLNKDEADSRIQELTDKNEHIEDIKNAYAENYNSILDVTQDFFSISKAKLGVDKNYDFINFDESLEEEDYPELTDEKKYGDEPDFYS